MTSREIDGRDVTRAPTSFGPRRREEKRHRGSGVQKRHCAEEEEKNPGAKAKAQSNMAGSSLDGAHPRSEKPIAGVHLSLDNKFREEELGQTKGLER